MTDLTNLTMAEALKGLENKDFTAAELTDGHCRAVEANRHLNAFITETLDLAVVQAESSGLPFAQFGDHAFDFFERGQNVRARRAQHLQGEGGIAVLVRVSHLFRRPHLDRGDVRQPHRLAVAPRQHQLAQLLDVVASGVTQGVLAAADVELAGGNIVGAGRQARDVGNAHAQCRGFRQIHRDAHVVLGGVVQAHAADARNRFDARADSSSLQITAYFLKFIFKALYSLLISLELCYFGYRMGTKGYRMLPIARVKGKSARCQID